MSTIQLFAHEIATHNATKINAAAARKGHDLKEMSPGLDYFKCVADLQAETIRDEVLPNIEDDALPLYLAPEFFFKCKERPFGYSAFYDGCAYLETLSGQIPNVLWVVGTIWWQNLDRNEERKTVVHNTSLVLRAGKIVHTWQKTKVSNLDGLRDDDGEAWDRKIKEYEDILEKSQSPFFTIDADGGTSLAVGMEVCLDHSSGVLKSEYIKDKGEAGAGVDLHILTAAGMSIHSEKVVARSGGYIVRCDGGEHPGRFRSECFRVAREHSKAPLRQEPRLRNIAVKDYIGGDRNNQLAVYNPIDFG